MVDPSVLGTSDVMGAPITFAVADRPTTAAAEQANQVKAIRRPIGLKRLTHVSIGRRG